MKDLLAKIHDHFDTKKKCFPIFVEHDARLEGWFKGELLQLFTKLELDFTCEKNFSYSKWERARRVDFAVTLEGVEHLIELKAAMVSAQENKARRTLRTYFGEDHIPHDAEKLRELDVSPDYKPGSKKHILVFIYPVPDVGEWKKLLEDRELQSPGYGFVQSDKSGAYSTALIDIQ